MSALDHEKFPRGALIAVSALIGFSLVAVTAVRVAKLNAPPAIVAEQPAPAASVDLKFSDAANGSISVENAKNGKVIAVIPSGDGGFVRGVMRGLAHDRIKRHIGPASPFRLALAKTGQMSLEDTATGRVIDLESFGVGNRGSFLDLLHAAEASS